MNLIINVLRYEIKINYFNESIIVNTIEKHCDLNSGVEFEKSACSNRNFNACFASLIVEISLIEETSLVLSVLCMVGWFLIKKKRLHTTYITCKSNNII